MKKTTTKVISIVALCVALNYVGGNLALLLKLPIYLDSIGTIFSAALLGPWVGMLTGTLSGLLSGVTTDLFSLYYIPVQILTGLMAGLILHRANKLRWLPLQSLAISLPGTVVSSAITAYLFHGITSSGSSLLVQVLAGLGLSKFASVLIIQVVTDYADRLISVGLVAAVITVLIKRKVVTFK
ncbi:hypothetical protein FC83_GL001654 [Agrilactobacillus composti DSM 18527 = JCM 14202]|uniref:Integral membrane protein n=1 Tax=Agrilactobacillus composti DSM 18527 = JCM 14202 TaxID=1423734 RepID=A0A0R1XK06_9LACO|nr:ECF transporter S component [Agrilactobacillus composti]KRM30520.1 hypothetical protein FC83_GL001654 [Agrilactobacillus composti DSM 18527 = JCM 14202]